MQLHNIERGAEKLDNHLSRLRILTQEGQANSPKYLPIKCTFPYVKKI